MPAAFAEYIIWIEMDLLFILPIFFQNYGRQNRIVRITDES